MPCRRRYGEPRQAEVAARGDPRGSRAPDRQADRPLAGSPGQDQRPRARPLGCARRGLLRLVRLQGAQAHEGCLRAARGRGPRPGEENARGAPRMRVASFTVHGTAEQSARWKRAAEAEGFASVGAWAAPALDAYLKARARAGRPLPLYWRRG